MDGDYKLIDGDEHWIVNTVDKRFNPVFVLQEHDGKFARELLRNLNAIRERGDASESRELAVTRGRN